jgi:hypothetical protein
MSFAAHTGYAGWGERGDEEYAELQEIGRVLKTGASSNPYRKLREGKTDP